MTQFEQEFNHKLEEIASELQNINLNGVFEQCSEYYDLKKAIDKIEERGISAKKQREDLGRFVENCKKQFEKENFRDFTERYIERLKNQLEKYNYDKFISSLFSAMQLSDEFCKSHQISGENINKILFEDWSGYGNLLMYGFSSSSKFSNDFGEVMIEEVEEFDLTFCYKDMKEVEEKERKLPIGIVSEKLIEYSDNVVRLILNKSLNELYTSNRIEVINNDSLFHKQIEFYHNHHDCNEIKVYVNK